MAPRGDVWSGLAAAVAQWFWDQGLRGGAGARWRDASKPLCVVDGAVDDDDLHEAATGPLIGLVLTDNAWDRRVPACRLGRLGRAAHACLAKTCRLRADRDAPGTSAYVEFIDAEEAGLKAGMALFASLHHPRVLGYPYPGKGSPAWRAVYGSAENEEPVSGV